jgi:hypothetical protein
MEKGVDVGAYIIEAPSGLRELGFALAMLLILILRPDGLVGRREFPMPARMRAVRDRGLSSGSDDSSGHVRVHEAESGRIALEERGNAGG